ncbi:MAG: type II secretion system F family protein [Acidimicrobiales bacterium]|nr:type II secretion system F family protein [Acidimicrobiales bacterium]
MNALKKLRLALVAVGLAVVFVPAGVSAQAPQFFVRQIDTTDPSSSMVDVIYTGDADPSTATVSVNGKQAPIKSASPLNHAEANTALAMVVASGPYFGETTSGLVNAKDAAKQLVAKYSAAKIPVAIYLAGDRAELIQSFTTDRNNLERAIDRIGPTQKTALWSAVRKAAGAFGGDNARLQPNLLVIAGDNDSVSPADQGPARGEVVSKGVTTFTVGLAGAMDPVQLQSLAALDGGIAFTTSDPAKVGDLVAEAGDVVASKQYRIVFDAGVSEGQVAEVVVNLGGQTAKASVLAGGVGRGKEQIDPQLTGGPGGIEFLQNWWGLGLGIVLVMAAVAGLAYAIPLLVVPDNDLSAVLQPYADGYVEGLEEDDEGSSLAKSALIQRAVELTEQVADSQGYLARTEAALERANLPLRAGEALFFYLSFVVLVTVLFLVILRNPVGGIVMGIIAALLPPAVVNFLASRRKKQFMAQLPDTLQLLSGTLRAGYSLMQGVEAVSQEVGEPMGLELRRVVTESRLGRPLEEALDGTAERMDSPDFAWAVMAIRIQREVGGNLSELLMTVAETMTARERLRREVAALTAEGRVSAFVLGILPIGLGLAMFVINPEYIGTLFKETLGLILLGLAGFSMLVGFFWMKKIIDIEI